MKKTFFKSVVATAVVTAAMALSSVAVFAATNTVTAENDGSWSVVATDFYTTDQAGSKVAPAYNPVYAVDSENSTVATIEVTTSTKTFTLQTYGTRSSSVTEDLYDYELLSGGSRTITVTPTVDGTVKVTWYGSSALKTTVGTASDTCTANTITTTSCATTANTGIEISLVTNAVLCEIAFEPGTVTTYSWTLDTSSLSSVTASYVTLANDTTTVTSNTLVYSGDDYAIKDDYETLTESIEGVTLEGTTFTVKPTDDWFEAVVARATITNSALFNASNLTASTISSGDVMDTYFELYSSNSSTATTDSAFISSYGNLEYSKRLKLGGTKRDIMFTIEEPAYVQVIFFTATNGDARSCYVGTTADSTSSYVATASNSSTSTAGVLNAYLSSAGTYYVYGGANIAIQSVNVVVGANLTAATSTDYAGAYVNGTNAYAIATVADLTADELTIATSSGSTIDTTSTVYDTVCVDNFVFTASDAATSGSGYVYAVKLTGVTDDATTAASNINSCTVTTSSAE